MTCIKCFCAVPCPIFLFVFQKEICNYSCERLTFKSRNQLVNQLSDVKSNSSINVGDL